MNETVHQVTREQLAEDRLEPQAAQHLSECDDCTAWSERLATIRHNVDALFLPSPESGSADDFADRVVASARGSSARRIRQRCLAVAAAVVVTIGGGAVITRLVTPASEQPKRSGLAAALEALTQSGGTRFVYAMTATVTPELRPAMPAATESSLLVTLPTCVNGPATTTTGDRSIADLAGQLADLLASDPCAGLRTIADTIGSAAEHSAEDLFTARNSADSLAASLDALQAESPLEQASYRTLGDRARHLRSEADSALAALRDATAAAADSLHPIADAANHDLASDDFHDRAADELRALAAIVDRDATPALDDPGSATWQQLATGTWSLDHIRLAGTTTQPDGQQTDIPAATGDPLQLTTITLATPAQLLDLLDTAPASTDAANALTWAPPTGALTYPGIDRWSVSVQLLDERLGTVTLTGTGASGTAITITITFAR